MPRYSDLRRVPRTPGCRLLSSWAGPGLSDHPVLTACLADTRGVLQLSGAGLIHFLQGLLTNDVMRLEPSGAAPMYACILNAQGRFLHDLFLHRTQEAVPTLLVDVDRGGKDSLLRLLRRYRLRQQVDMHDVSQQYRVWAHFGCTDSNSSRASCDRHTATGLTQPVHGSTLGFGLAESAPGWPPDPRLPELGLRAIIPVDASPADAHGVGPSSSCFSGAVSSDAVSSSGSSSAGNGGGSEAHAYRRWRILHGVAEGDSEIPSGEVVPLEYNIDGLRAISFTKGCYVGQELMARTHFKGVVRKRLMPCTLLPPAGSSGGGGGDSSSDVAFSSSGNAGLHSGARSAGLGSDPGDARLSGAGVPGASSAPDVQPGTALFVETAGEGRREIGSMRVVDGGVGLAVLRLGAVQAAQAAGEALWVDSSRGGRLQVQPWRPQWWPQSWGHEELGP